MPFAATPRDYLSEEIQKERDKHTTQYHLYVESNTPHKMNLATKQTHRH